MSTTCLLRTGMLIMSIGFISNEELKLVTVLFRHGDRTPDIRSSYPLDPYINETYFPIGLGQLTNKGKHRAFGFGQLLRQRYGSFLGEIHLPDHVEAISTNMDRTIASLKLVLAGVFPPNSKDFDWNLLLNWQPIPYNTTSFKYDLWMTLPFENCPKFVDHYQKYINSPAGLNFLKRNSKLYDYLQFNTGLNLTSPVGVWSLYTYLLSQVEWGLALPEWAKFIFPDTLEQASVELMHTHVATTDLRRLSGGLMLKKIINNMAAKVKNKLVPEKRKLILYAGHDVNILHLSAVLEQVINHTIPYCSYLMFELMEFEGLHYVQVFSNDYVTQNITALKIPGCDFKCPLDIFEELSKKYTSVDDDACWNP